MDGMWVQNIVAIVAIFLIPLTGLTVILTSRLAIKPLVETLAKALKESGMGVSPELLNQVNHLADQVDALTEHVQRLEAAQDFDRKLLETPTRDAAPSG